VSSDSLEGEALPAPAPSGKSLLREIIETVLLTVLIYVAVNFATGRFRIEGSSMEPSMHPNQYVLVDKLSYMLGDPKRGDVIVFNYPQATDRDFIKRVIGLPGETVAVRGGVVYVNDVPLDEPYISAPPTYESTWTLGPNEYFVLGDNRNSSSDSHAWGPLARHYFIGRAVLVYWPPDLWGTVPHYTYAADLAASTPAAAATAPPGTALPLETAYPAGGAAIEPRATTGPYPPPAYP
jgi:signal peptidase I